MTPAENTLSLVSVSNMKTGQLYLVPVSDAIDYLMEVISQHNDDWQMCNEQVIDICHILERIVHYNLINGAYNHIDYKGIVMTLSDFGYQDSGSCEIIEVASSILINQILAYLPELKQPSFNSRCQYRMFRRDVLEITILPSNAQQSTL